MKKFFLYLTGLLTSPSLVFGATFVDWEAEDTTAMIGYVKDLITDLTPLLIPIIAIGLGLIIFAVVVSVIRKQ